MSIRCAVDDRKSRTFTRLLASPSGASAAAKYGFSLYLHILAVEFTGVWFCPEVSPPLHLRTLCATIAERLAGDPTDAPQPVARPATEPRKQDIGELLSRLGSLSAEEIEQAMAEFDPLEGSN